MNTIDEIKEIFYSEFGFVADRFEIIELALLEASSSTINLPGVYVHWSPTLGAVKVGKSQKNSRKRAMEHIRDNTHNKGDESYGMARLQNEPGSKLLLFNVNEQRNAHWLLSLEYFLESRLGPFVSSDRRG